jgi:hypothetical protein
MNPEPARILRFSGVLARQAGVAGGYLNRCERCANQWFIR